MTNTGSYIEYSPHYLNHRATLHMFNKRCYSSHESDEFVCVLCRRQNCCSLSLTIRLGQPRPWLRQHTWQVRPITPPAPITP